jgi:ankyrin repeat protein
MTCRVIIVAGAVVLALTAVRAHAQPAPVAFERAQVPASTADKAEALSEAARKGDAAAVKTLLDAGVDVDTKYRYNRTALSYAADRGHVAIVKLLLERGADVNVKDTFYGATALTWAVGPAMERKPAHTEVVGLLLQHGGIPPDDLSAALDQATREKLTDVVALLERAGAKRKEK